MVRRLLLPLLLLGAVALWNSQVSGPEPLRETLRRNASRLSVEGLRLGDSTARVREAWAEHLKQDPERLPPGIRVLRWVDDYRVPAVGLSEEGRVMFVSGLSLDLEGTPLVLTGEEPPRALGPPDAVLEHEGTPDVWSYRLGEVDLELCLSDSDRAVFVVGLRDRNAPLRMGLYGQAVPTSGAGSSPGPSPAPSRR